MFYFVAVFDWVISMLYTSKFERKDYYPPVLGNGDIAFSVDCEGTLNYSFDDFGGDGVKLSLNGGLLIRAGRREQV